jgi:hypothetical protein
MWTFPPSAGQQWLNKATSTDGSTGVADAVIIESLHNRTIFFEVEAIELILEVGPIFRGDIADEIDVLIGMESSEFLLGGIVLIDIRKLEILNSWTLTIVSKCWSMLYFLTISSVMATLSGFMGCAKA